MPLSLKRTGTSAVYGALDIGTEYADSSMGLAGKPFQNITDIQRTIAVVGGGLAAHFGSGDVEELGEAVELSAIPLLEKSAFNAVASFTGASFRARSRGQIMIRRPTGGGAATAPGGVPGTLY